MSKATVYNTLNLFARNGLVRAIKVEGDCTLYDSNIENHAHFYNLDSGEITDIDAVRVHELPLPPDDYRHHTGNRYGAAYGRNDVWQ